MYPDSLENNLKTSIYTIEKHGFDLILEVGINNKCILEIACGTGFYSKWLAKNYLDCEVIGVDFDSEKIKIAKENSNNLNNLNYFTCDVSNMLQFKNNSFDLIYARSTLHHLTNNLSGVANEVHRVLKPNCKCIFLREPLGHNPIWAGVRAMVNSKKQLTDESNLYIKNIIEFSKPFSNYTLYSFDFFLYMIKIFPSLTFTKYLTSIISTIDRFLFNKIPILRKYGANVNIVFTNR